MKKILLIAFVALLTLTGCAKEPQDNTVGGDPATELQTSGKVSRTHKFDIFGEELAIKFDYTTPANWDEKSPLTFNMVAIPETQHSNYAIMISEIEVNAHTKLDGNNSHDTIMLDAEGKDYKMLPTGGIAINSINSFETDLTISSAGETGIKNQFFGNNLVIDVEVEILVRENSTNRLFQRQVTERIIVPQA